MTLPKRKTGYWLGAISGAVVIGCAVVVTLLTVFQDKLVYRIQRYGPNAAAPVIGERSALTLPYRTASGRQFAYYIAPANGRFPGKLWIMFGGNGAAILDYKGSLPEQPLLAGDSFLLVDYPGYGYNDGHPSAAAISENADGALAALASRLKTSKESLLANAGVFGHSFGTGVALEFARSHPEIRRIALVSPFTSLYAVSYLRVGPAALFLHHNFDNDAVLQELSKRHPRPAVVIFHGDQDQIVPVTMSRTLAANNKWVVYHEMRGMEHGKIVYDAAPEIAEAMAAMEKQLPTQSTAKLPL